MSWHHAPRHSTDGGGTFLITASTLNRMHIYRSRASLDALVNQFLGRLDEARWSIGAWIVFSNHYHVVADVPGDAEPVADTIRDLHSKLSSAANAADATPGRQVWFQYWDTELTYPRSVLARSAYVWHNPVHHRLVRVAEEYPWCSAGAERQHTGRFSKATLRSFRPDKIRILDDFEPIGVVD
jgi:putative transposase